MSDPGIAFGTDGGATSPNWGLIKLHAWVALGSGRTWTLGPHPQSRFDSGNVLGRYPHGATPNPEPDPSTSSVARLWHDVSCDVIDATVQTGATQSAGVFARAEAGTCTLTLADPDRLYDPLNPHSPWHYQGRSRLVPGTPILVWAEMLQYGTFIVRNTLFVGTVDSWRCPWTPHASERKTVLQCTDATSALVARQRPEVAPVGAGDTVDQRLARILDYHDGPALLTDLESTVTLQATTMAGNAWQQLNEAVDAEAGFVYVTPYYADPLDALTTEALVGVRFLARQIWADPTGPTVSVACPILIDATVGALDLQIRNRVTAGRKDGTPVTVRSDQSIQRYGEHGYSRTDLQLETDTEAGQWAAYVLSMFAFPRATLTDVTMRPALEVDAWPRILGVDLVSERVAVQWTPPGSTDSYDTVARVVGRTLSINFERFEVKWVLAAGETAGHTWTLGPHDNDRFDAGNVLGYTPA